jgi:hypothetical protein
VDRCCPSLLLLEPSQTTVSRFFRRPEKTCGPFSLLQSKYCRTIHLCQLALPAVPVNLVFQINLVAPGRPPLNTIRLSSLNSSSAYASRWARRAASSAFLEWRFPVDTEAVDGPIEATVFGSEVDGSALLGVLESSGRNGVPCLGVLAGDGDAVIEMRMGLRALLGSSLLRKAYLEEYWLRYGNAYRIRMEPSQESSSAYNGSVADGEPGRELFDWSGSPVSVGVDFSLTCVWAPRFDGLSETSASVADSSELELYTMGRVFHFLHEFTGLWMLSVRFCLVIYGTNVTGVEATRLLRGITSRNEPSSSATPTGSLTVLTGGLCRLNPPVLE